MRLHTAGATAPARRRAGYCALPNGAYKAITPSAQRVNAPLRLATVANGLASLHHSVVQRGLTDKPLRPDVPQEFPAGDNALPMRDEIAQNREDLRLQGA